MSFPSQQLSPSRSLRSRLTYSKHKKTSSQEHLLNAATTSVARAKELAQKKKESRLQKEASKNLVKFGIFTTLKSHQSKSSKVSKSLNSRKSKKGSKKRSKTGNVSRQQSSQNSS